MDKTKTCCFTGHRPEKLKISEIEAKKLLCSAIEDALKRGYRNFICGMAKGIDIWSGELICEFKNIYPDIKLICALPFPAFAQNAPHIIKKADYTHTVTDHYSIHSYQRRNEWMVDNSSLVIAFFTGEKGGTLNTVKYAEENGVEVIFLKKPPLFNQLTFRKIYGL